jgi:quercetin dioxygenase-like cupin family protein
MTDKTGLVDTVRSAEDYGALRERWKQGAARPQMVTRAEAEVFETANADQSIAVLLSGADTAGESAVFEVTCQPAGGAPPHRQSNESEYFYVVEGRFEVRINDEVRELGPGGLAFAPKNAIHAFRNIGATAGKFLSWNNPAGHELFFRAMTNAGLAGAPLPELLDRAAHFDTTPVMEPAGAER